VKSIKHVKFSVLCLAGLCMMATFAFGATGSASAKVLLFKTTTGFPYHLTGTSAAATRLLTVTGGAITSTGLDALALILNSTLFDARLIFLGSRSPALNETCQTPGDPAGTILLNLLGHLGLTHPSDLPGVLLLIPNGFSFECSGLTVDVRGSVIGLITKPKILTAGQTELGLSFEQKNGVQNHTAFLLGNTLLTNQFLESNILGVSPGFEQAGQEAAVTLKATGAGTFEISDE
jgi:hypothetical protein